MNKLNLKEVNQKIRTLMAGSVAPGYHTLVWNGRDETSRQVGAGLYLYLLETDEFRQTRKMLLVK